MKTAYLDIETHYVGRFPQGDQRLFKDYPNHRITVIGIRIMDKTEDRLVQLVGPDASLQTLMKALEGVGRIVTYNGRSVPDRIKGYTGFDFPVIAAQLGVVLDREFKHLDLAPECWRRGLYGGQKEVERKLGLKRELPGKDGLWAAETWQAYQKSSEPRLLEDLLTYNREDVYMLHSIQEGLARLK